MTKKLFGKLDTGVPVYSYTLENEEIFAEIITFGAAIRRFGFSDRRERNFVGSFDSLSDYINDNSHQGAIIGRVANRIENATFKMDNKTYRLTKNDGENCLHGGNGFDRKIWDVTFASSDTVTLSYRSEDGEEGFPSALTANVTYKLISSALLIKYEAIPDGRTPIAMTNHAYFNLLGMGDTVYSHKAQIFAESYTAVNEKLIPSGEHPSVFGTEFDLRSPRLLGDIIGKDFFGFDHNFVLSPTEYEIFDGKILGLAATVSVPEVKLSVYTDMPGVQFYTANFLKEKPDFSGGIKRIRHGAFCLEAGTEPNSVNRGVGFYGKGEIYTQNTVYKIEKTKEER